MRVVRRVVSLLAKSRIVGAKEPDNPEQAGAGAAQRHLIAPPALSIEQRSSSPAPAVDIARHSGVIPGTRRGLPALAGCTAESTGPTEDSF